jgi:hypothetical protein
VTVTGGPDDAVPRRKIWRHERLITEHAFDKLRILDCGFGEFTAALEEAEVIEEHVVPDDQVKELLLVIDWTRPLHVVVVVDDRHEEERIVTVYEPEPGRWDDEYRRRR